MGLAFLSGANPFLFFLERKESKRKSSADHAFALFKAVYAILLHKTDGSYVNRLLFLEEKTVGLRGKRSPSDGRLLFFLEEKKQKKIICRTATSLRSCLFHQPVAQNGRFVCEPSVFRSWQNVRESVFSQKNILPRSVFCFFSSRKENVPFQEKKSYPLEEKERGERRPHPAGMGSGSGAGIAVCESFVPRSIVGTFTRQPFG